MDYAEAYDRYAAQGIQQIDAEIVKKSHFWMETNEKARRSGLWLLFLLALGHSLEFFRTFRHVRTPDSLHKGRILRVA